MALLIISTSATLFLAEALLNRYYSRQPFSCSVYSRQSLNEVYNSRFVSHPYLPYAAKPGLRQSYIHRDELHSCYDTIIYNTNSLGFRFPIKPFDKADNEKVIVFLGGSTTWDGPEDSLTWPALLTQELNNYYSKYNVQVSEINLAIDGGNSAHSLTNLLLWGICFKPDLVISYDGINDFFDLGAYRKTLPDYSDAMKKVDDNIRPFIRNFPSFIRGSFLIQLLCNSIDRLTHGDMTIYAQMYRQPPLPINQWQIPVCESFRRNIRCMRSISKGVHAAFLATIPHVYRPEGNYLGFADTLKTYWQTDSVVYVSMLDSFSANNLRYHYDPVHFTRTGLQKVADVYSHYIIKTNLLNINGQ